MNRVNKPNEDGFIVIDFDGHVKAECRSVELRTATSSLKGR